MKGTGKITYVNGDIVEGRFEKGQANGIMTYTFATTGKSRLARYIRGERIEWLEDVLKKGVALLQWMHKNVKAN